MFGSTFTGACVVSGGIAAYPWHPMDTVPKDGSVIAVCFHEWNVATNPLRIQLAQWIDLYGDGGKLCAPYDFDSEAFAIGWLRLAELAAAHDTAPVQS